MREESTNWWKQSKADLSAASVNITTHQYYVAVFLCHQAAEKALKALYIEKKRKLPPATHGLQKLGRLLSIPRHLFSALNELNPDYIITRYPDAANGIPAEQYDEDSAKLHLAMARKVVKWAEKGLKTK